MSLPANTIVGNSQGSRGEPENLSCTAAGFAMVAAADAAAQAALISAVGLSAPSDAKYYTQTSNGSLSAEVVAHAIADAFIRTGTLHIQSPDLSYWALGISNLGVPSWTNIGGTLP